MVACNEFIKIDETSIFLNNLAVTPQDSLNIAMYPDIDPNLSLEDAVSSFWAQTLLIAAIILEGQYSGRSIIVTPDLRSAVIYLHSLERQSALQ